LEADNNFQVRRLPCSEIDGKLQVDPDKLVNAEELEHEITKLFLPEDDRNTALLFFAGHGLPKPLGKLKQILLATSDANPRKKLHGVLLRDLWEIVEQSSVKEQIIWLDSCHSGELLEFKKSDLLERVPGRQRFLIAASHSSEVAYERLDGKHGVLSGALIEGLNPNRMPQNQWITDRKLADFVEEKLKAYYLEAKLPQQPQIRRPDREINLVLGKNSSNINQPTQPKPSVVRKIPFVLPQLDVSTFTGREEELRQLEDLLLNRQGTKVCSIAGLAGVGGIGKSALACHFATIHKDDFPDGVIGSRVDGKNLDAIAREFARQCGEEIDSEDERDASTIMQEVFASRRMLLIFDNAEEANIRALRPGGERCAVIVTTRDRGLPISLDIPDNGRINLPILSDPDSLNLLQKLLGEKRVAAEPEAASLLIKLSGQLPLALQIIGAALKLHKGRNLTEYATSLSEERRLTRLRVRGDEHLDVRSSFSLSLKLLKPEEIDFFACLSVCAEDGFSLRTAMATNDCDDYTAQDYLDYLYKLSLLNFSESGKNRFVFHPLIRLFAQDLAVERNLQDEAQARHAQFFIDFVKSYQVNDPSTVSLLAQELKGIVLAGEWLQRQKIADYRFAICLLPFFQKYGYWQQAVDFMSGFQSLAKRKEDWYVVVLLCSQQAKYLSLLGQWSRAEEVLKEIAEIPDKIQVQDTCQRCRVIWFEALGKIFQRQGRLEEAVTILQHCVLIAEQLNDQRYLGISLNVLRNVLQQQSRLDDAVIVLQRSVKSAEQINSQNSLVVCLNVLARVRQENECFDEAVELFQRSVEITEQLDNKKELLISLNSLGELLGLQGYIDATTKVFQRIVEIREKLENTKELIISLVTLGILLSKQERFDEAVAVAFRTLELINKLDNKEEVFNKILSLVFQLERKINFDTYEIAFGEQLVEIAKQLGNKKLLIDRLNLLGRAWQRKGSLNEALRIFQHSVELAEPLNSKKWLINSLIYLGIVLQEQRKFNEAVTIFQRCVELAKQFNLKKLLSPSLKNLGESLLQQGNIDAALITFQQLIDIIEDTNDKNNLIVSLNYWGKTLQQQERFDEAIAILECNLEIAQHWGDQLSLIIVLNSLGWVLRQQQKWDEAEKILRRSQDICQDLNESGNLLVIALHNLGIIFEKQQNWDEAEKILRRSYDLCVKLEDQRGQAMILNSLGQLIYKQEGEDKFQLALMYFKASIKLGEQLHDQGHLAKAHTAMGKALLAHGETNKATEEFCKGFEIDESLTNRFGLGKVTPQLTHALVRLGKRDEALAYCQRALAIDPKNRQLQELCDRLSSPNPIKKGTVKHIRYNT
jgi:tetratricopeptide (TPR) repeat protein